MSQLETKIETLEECRTYIGYDLLTDRAKRVFLDKCSELIKQGQLIPVFLDQIVLYAHAYDTFWTLDDEVKANGLVLESRDKRGDLRSYANPAAKMRTDALRDVIRIGKNFGFSKLDRERFDDPLGPDPLAEWRRSLQEESES